MEVFHIKSMERLTITYLCIVFLLDTLNVQCWLILFILNTCKQVIWQAVNTQTAFHQCLLCLLRKINNLQVQIYINLKTVNRFKYKMDYSLVVYQCVYNNPRESRGLKTEDIFCEKCPQTWLFLGDKWPKSGSKFEKMAQKNLIGENGGERKINPSANPVSGAQKNRHIRWFF